jgi:hypothetical protein
MVTLKKQAKEILMRFENHPDYLLGLVKAQQEAWEHIYPPASVLIVRADGTTSLQVGLDLDDLADDVVAWIHLWSRDDVYEYAWEVEQDAAKEAGREPDEDLCDFDDAWIFWAHGQERRIEYNDSYFQRLKERKEAREAELADFKDELDDLTANIQKRLVDIRELLKDRERARRRFDELKRPSLKCG